MFRFIPKNEFFLAFLASTRLHNIVLVSLAEYLTALFILSEQSFYTTLSNYELHLLVLASAFSLTSGYLINNFYDQEKDQINYPLRSQLRKVLSTQAYLIQYLIYNGLALSCAALVSGKAVLFFIVYQTLLWFYSHKLNKILFINNISNSILSIFPVFALYLYYKNFNFNLWIHAAYLLSILYLIDVIKDLMSFQSDQLYNYPTLVNQLGTQRTKIIISICSIINNLLALFIIYLQNNSYIIYFFILSIFVVSFLMISIWMTNQSKTYQWIYLTFKIVLVIGVFSLALIHFD